jgi:hypothetical protein
MSDPPLTAETKTSENVPSQTSSRGSVGQVEQNTDNHAPSLPQNSFLDSLPPWVSTNLRSPNSWKLLARCWLGSWAAFLLLIPHASLNILGNTYVANSFVLDHLINSAVGDPCRAFFAVLTSLFLPANLPIQMFLFVSTYPCYYSSIRLLNALYISQIISTLMIGVLLGWAIGVAAMRGALAARDQVLLRNTLQKVQSRYVRGVHYDHYRPLTSAL